MNSIWTETEKAVHFAPLQGNRNTDVLIIGGGIAGLLCAKKLQEAGAEYILCEADTLCSGITKNTTAKITAQHGLCYHKLLDKFGTEKSKLYLQANQAAVEEYAQLCAGIDCDFSRQDNFVYSMSSRKNLEKELTAMQKLKFPAEFIKNFCITH